MLKIILCLFKIYIYFFIIIIIIFLYEKYYKYTKKCEINYIYNKLRDSVNWRKKLLNKEKC